MYNYDMYKGRRFLGSPQYIWVKLCILLISYGFVPLSILKMDELPLFTFNVNGRIIEMNESQSVISKGPQWK